MSGSIENEINIFFPYSLQEGFSSDSTWTIDFWINFFVHNSFNDIKLAFTIQLISNICSFAVDEYSIVKSWICWELIWTSYSAPLTRLFSEFKHQYENRRFVNLANRPSESFLKSLFGWNLGLKQAIRMEKSFIWSMGIRQIP